MNSKSLTILVFALVGCSRSHSITLEEVRSIADNAVQTYCRETRQQDCINMSYIGLASSESGWLVEYSSDGYLHAVLVKRDGDVELSRFAETSE